MVFSALAFAQCEVLWYFQHVGIASSKSKAVRMVPVEIVSQVSCLCLNLSRLVFFSPSPTDNKVLDFKSCDFVYRTQVIQLLGSYWMEWTIYAVWYASTLQVRLNLVYVIYLNGGKIW